MADIGQDHQAAPLQQDDHRILQPLAAQPPQSAPIDSLTCQWVACGERCTSPEALYDHVCERHVGRKSTNNLNLTCQWGACRTTTVKRDHITSHMRVHVPLKPHKCDFCGKSFKRPQDLKKHVKTHADDSVIVRSPENSMNQQQGGSNGYQQDSKNGAYFNAPGHDMSGGPYPSHNQVPSNGQNFYPNPPQYSGYGQVNYPQNTLADQQSMDTRKRAIEALNEFLGDVKRRALDPTTYYDVGQRLQTNNLPLPVSIGSGYSLGSGYNSQQYNSNSNMLDSFGGSNGGISLSGGGASVAGPLAQSYSLPMSNARTKTDLLEIDRFLEQLSTTVYETSSSAAAAGVQQPGVHSQTPTGYNFPDHYRNSNSPPQYQQQNGGSSVSAGVQPLTSVAQLATMAANAQGTDTPALTPASLSSYASSGHSPMSSHSRSSLDNGSMYPTLPSVTATSDMGSGYTSAPPSNLSSGFEAFGEGRRYSGGRLQREAPARRSCDAMDVDSSRKGSSSLDPALRSTPPEKRTAEETATTTPSQSSESTADDKAQEAWVENIRVIETLRKWIGERLANKEFERDGEATPEAEQREEGNELELVKREVERTDDDTAMEVQEVEQEGEIAYPTLKAEVLA